MTALFVLTVFSGGVAAWALASRNGGFAPESLQFALESCGLDYRIVRRGRWLIRGLSAQAALGGRSFEVRLDPALGRTARVTLQLEGDFDRSARLQVHFGEQTRWVLGDEALAAALLTERVRAATGSGDQLHVAEGSVSLLSFHLAGAGHAAAALAEVATRLGTASQGRLDVESLLRETASSDMDPRARAEAVSCLLERQPGLAAEFAVDPAPEVRLAVACAVRGQLGFELASEILTSEIFHAEIQQGALRYLLSSHGPEELGPVLVGALSGADDNLLGALVQALAALGHEGAVAALHAQLPTANLRNAARIAEALAALEGEAAELALVALLDRLPASGPVLPDEKELAATVADALGRVGRQPALVSLRTLSEQVGPESPVGIAVKVALDLIRARTGAASLSGALALAGASGVGGRLSPPGASEII